MLWANELVWTLDIFRKFLVKPKKSRATDTYEIAVAYIKSTLIIDLIATLPQLTSGLGVKFIPFKILRLINYLWALHYPYEAFVHGFQSGKDRRHQFVLVYACSTLCRITLLLHYLAIVWVWIGSESFADYEQGYLPWQLEN